MSNHNLIQALRNPISRSSETQLDNPVGNILEELDNENDLFLSGGGAETQTLIPPPGALSKFLGDQDGVCTITKECHQWCS